MRVFCAVRHAVDPKEFYGALWSSNFYPALRELGHEIVESQTDLAPASAFMDVGSGFTPAQSQTRARITQGILDELRAEHAREPVDVFLSYFYASHFDPAGFDEIRKLGIPSINYYCNSMYQFELVEPIARAADWSWHAEKPARDRYLRVGARPVWVQMGADPNVYRPVPGLTREPKACFVGQRYADRDRWMAHLIRAGVPCDLYGPGWGAPAEKGQKAGPATSAQTASHKPKGTPAQRDIDVVRRNVAAQGLVAGLARSHRQYRYRRETRALMPLFAPIAKGAIPFTKICEVFSSYEVILNFANVWADGRPGSGLIPHVRLRDFEAPMCRTCYLTQYTDELTEFYEPEREVATYRSPEELADKVKFYLAHPDKAEALREAGYRRALRDHTWVQRFRQLFRETGLSPGATPGVRLQSQPAGETAK